MKKFILRIWNTPPIHHLLMVVYGGITGALGALIYTAIKSQTLPTFHQVLLCILGGAGAALSAYWGKNGSVGPSGPAMVLPPVDNTQAAFPPPGEAPKNPSIQQKGKFI